MTVRGGCYKTFLQGFRLIKRIFAFADTGEHSTWMLPLAVLCCSIVAILMLGELEKKRPTQTPIIKSPWKPWNSFVKMSSQALLMISTSCWELTV